MKERISTFLGALILFPLAIYFTSFLVITPYFFWQYAKHHGLIKVLTLGPIVAAAKSAVWPYYIFGAKDAPPGPPGLEARIAEYKDSEYGYAFQVPSDWKMLKPPPKGEAGEVRVVMKSLKSTTLMAIVGKLGRSITKQAFVNNPNGDALVDVLINHTLESVYKKVSRDIGATRMVVAEKRVIPSEMAVKWYISTVHFVKTDGGEKPIVVAGIQYIPFEKDYLVTFLLTSPLNAKATDENETVENVFNSFHLVGEKPGSPDFRPKKHKLKAEDRY